VTTKIYVCLIDLSSMLNPRVIHMQTPSFQHNDLSQTKKKERKKLASYKKLTNITEKNKAGEKYVRHRPFALMADQ
jgi:hypothetical protein